MTLLTLYNNALDLITTLAIDRQDRPTSRQACVRGKEHVLAYVHLQQVCVSLLQSHKRAFQDLRYSDPFKFRALEENNANTFDFHHWVAIDHEEYADFQARLPRYIAAQDGVWTGSFPDQPLKGRSHFSLHVIPGRGLS